MKDYFIDCTQCEFGANGRKNCNAGNRIKKAGKGGCFLGKRLSKKVIDYIQGVYR